MFQVHVAQANDGFTSEILEENKRTISTHTQAMFLSIPLPGPWSDLLKWQHFLHLQDRLALYCNSHKATSRLILKLYVKIAAIVFLGRSLFKTKALQKQLQSPETRVGGRNSQMLCCFSSSTFEQMPLTL